MGIEIYTEAGQHFTCPICGKECGSLFESKLHRCNTETIRIGQESAPKADTA